MEVDLHFAPRGISDLIMISSVCVITNSAANHDFTPIHIISRYYIERYCKMTNSSFREGA